MARAFGDRTAQMLGRLSLNPTRHIDPVGTLLVPAVLLAIGAPILGWAKPVPVATSALRHPRLARVAVILAGPVANLAMALIWSGVLVLVVRQSGNQTLINWLALMAEAGIWFNVVLALFNLLPVPPLDCGRLLTGWVPQRWGSRLDKIEPVSLFLVLGLAAVRALDWLFEPAYRTMARCINLLLGAPA
jgi:Zn-dependent protease